MNKDQKNRIISYLVIIIAAGIVYLIVNNIKDIIGLFKTLLTAIQPLIVGIFIALILNVPMKRIENKLIEKDLTGKRNNRVWALVITYLLFAIFFVVVVSIIVPQLTSSLATLAGNASRYAVTIADLINSTLKKIGIGYQIPTSELSDLGAALTKWLTAYFEKINNIISDLVPGFIGDITSVIGSLLESLFNIMMSIVFSAHILLKKEKLLNQTDRVLRAFLKPAWVEKIEYISRMANEIFSDFLGGQLVDMGILGVIFFVAMMILRMPYAFLISFTIAITGIIPYFGAAFGILFGAILILAEKGFITMIFFIVIFEVLQQIENNLVYPKIVGNSVGLEPIWVLFSLLFFGKLFGLIGMVLSPPLMALIYTLVSEEVQTRLEGKE